MSCANADTVKAVTVTIKRKSRCIAVEVMVRRKPQRTGNAFMFPLRDFLLHRAIDLLIYTNLPVNATSFTAALRVCSDPTAFAACLEISANLRKPGELTNPPVEGRRQ